jgi:hypothetical protein
MIWSTAPGLSEPMSVVQPDDGALVRRWYPWSGVASGSPRHEGVSIINQ